jgi:arylsulfatase A-like enzyme
LELAGIAAPKEYQGKSFVAMLKNPRAETRTEVFSEHNWHDYQAFERMVRTRDFLYLVNGLPNLTNCGPADSKRSPTQIALNHLRDIGKLTPAQTDVFVTPRPSEELYDVKNDPEQLINLASVPKYRQKLEEMRSMILKWQSETGDSMPEKLTPDNFDRETGNPLRKNKQPVL